MKRLFLSLTALSVIFTMSCKGPKGDVGPAGASGQNLNPAEFFTSKDGYVKGTATGKMADSTAFSYNVDLEGNYDSQSNYFTINSPTETSIRVDKVYSGEGDALPYGEIYFDFTVPDLKTVTSPALSDFSVSFNKDLGNNKYFSFSSYYSGGGNGVTATLSGLSYDSTTSTLKGNYTFYAPAVNNHGRLSITDGTFSTKIYQQVMKKAAN